uniref:(northern house mosquito) hypothetical protein n=1 Tax=Culex pipiens TaxID=7175 RepID=A0A8D8FDW3_CULPI
MSSLIDSSRSVRIRSIISMASSRFSTKWVQGFSRTNAHTNTLSLDPQKNRSRKGGKNSTNLGQKVNLSVYLAGFATLPCSKCRHLCTYSAHNYCVLRFLSKFFEAIWISGQSSRWRTKRLICAHFP